MAGFISRETIDAVEKTADIVSVVGEYVRLEQRGSDWWGCCPFHSEKTPSFHVMPDKNMYYCFGCHAGGSPIKFIMEMEKIAFPEAVSQLAKKSGIEIKYEVGSSEIPKEDNKKAEYISLYDRTASMFHYILTQTSGGKFALDYIKGRGITDETIEKFKLGYSPADRRWLKTFLRGKNFSDDFLNGSGLFSKKYPDVSFFSDRLMFPIFDRRGQCVAFGGRILRGEGPKYLNSGEMIQYSKRETLFAFNFAKAAIRENKRVIFCEGYMDCIAYHQCGISYAVAPLGTALTAEQVKIIRGFVDTVYLSFDSDGAGQAATRKAILLCRSQGLAVKVIRLKGGKDPAEIMINYGKEALTNAINSAILDDKYLFEVLSHIYPVDTPEGKARAALEFFPYVDALQTDIQKESSLDELGQVFNISPEAVRRDFNNRSEARDRSEPQQSAEKNETRKSVTLDAELRAMLAVTAKPDLFSRMSGILTPGDFQNPDAQKIFIVLQECSQRGDLNLDSIVNSVEEPVLRQRMMTSLASGEFSVNTEQTVEDGVQFVIKNNLERKRDGLLARIRSFQPVTPDDEQIMKSLLQQKMDIDKKLKSSKKEQTWIRN